MATLPPLETLLINHSAVGIIKMPLVHADNPVDREIQANALLARLALQTLAAALITLERHHQLSAVSVLIHLLKD
jgi:hypothetical protein